MTDISKLGEFGLISRLTDGHNPKNSSTLYGVGDDCAVLHYPDKEVLVTTDMLMEGVHFDLTYIDMQTLGYKSAMVNISDIFAMNGTPRQMTVSMALSKRFAVEDVENFYSGLRMACEKWGVDIVGGDTTSSYTGLAISITCIGEAAKDEIVYRNGAKETAREETRHCSTSWSISNPTLPERNICCSDSSGLRPVATSSSVSGMPMSSRRR